MNDGGPAFPPNAGWRDNDPAGHGMSLRDWFAGQALAGCEGVHMMTGERGGNEIAKRCYELADAMLKAREAKP